MTKDGFLPHDHSNCITSAMRFADDYCQKHNLKLTPVRRRVLELLLAEHRAMGAYDILGHLGPEGLGNQPPVAYRALDFLVRHGFAHKIERLNAYVACAHSGHHHLPAFLICRECKLVQECDAVPLQRTLDASAKSNGFAIEHAMFEAEGLCPICAEAST